MICKTRGTVDLRELLVTTNLHNSSSAFCSRVCFSGLNALKRFKEDRGDELRAVRFPNAAPYGTRVDHRSLRRIPGQGTVRAGRCVHCGRVTHRIIPRQTSETHKQNVGRSQPKRRKAGQWKRPVYAVNDCVSPKGNFQFAVLDFESNPTINACHVSLERHEIVGDVPFNPGTAPFSIELRVFRQNRFTFAFTIKATYWLLILKPK